MLEKALGFDDHSRAQDTIRLLLDYCTLSSVLYVQKTIEDAVANAPSTVDEYLTHALDVKRVKPRMARDICDIVDGIISRWDDHNTHRFAEHFRTGCPERAADGAEKKVLRRRRMWPLLTAAAVLCMALSIGWTSTAFDLRAEAQENESLLAQLEDDRAQLVAKSALIAELSAELDELIGALDVVTEMTEVFATGELSNPKAALAMIQYLRNVSAQKRSYKDAFKEAILAEQEQP